MPVTRRLKAKSSSLMAATKASAAKAHSTSGHNSQPNMIDEIKLGCGSTGRATSPHVTSTRAVTRANIQPKSSSIASLASHSEASTPSKVVTSSTTVGGTVETLEPSAADTRSAPTIDSTISHHDAPAVAEATLARATATASASVGKDSTAACDSGIKTLAETKPVPSVDKPTYEDTNARDPSVELPADAKPFLWQELPPRLLIVLLQSKLL